MSSQSNRYALEAAISRSYKTLDLMFPGVELEVVPDKYNMRDCIMVRYTHPKLGRLGWNVSVDTWAMDRHEGYVEYLMRDIPKGFTYALLEAAENHASANRYTWGGSA
jgi:hypothetical protein